MLRFARQFGALCLIAISLRPVAIAQQNLIGPGDVLKITVFKNPELSTEVKVSDMGTIGFPLLGSVKLAGRTLSDAENTIALRLKDGGYVLNPQVNILMSVAVANQVAVLGSVNKPGRYPLETGGGHVSGMLAAAGGIASDGADSVIVTGTRNGKEFHREIDVVALSQGDGSSEDVALSGGDTLFVNRAPNFYVFGQVQRPGQYRLQRDMTVMQAISAGGGLTNSGSKRGIVVHRKDDHGRIKDLRVDLNFALQPNDTVEVKESIF